MKSVAQRKAEEYIGGDTPRQLRVGPMMSGDARYVSMTFEYDAEEIQTGPRTRIRCQAVYVPKTNELKGFEILKFILERGVWEQRQRLTINSQKRSDVIGFLRLLSSLKLDEAQPANVEGIDSEGLDTSSLLSIVDPRTLNEFVAHSANVDADLAAISAQRAAVEKFDEMLRGKFDEREWQAFFEKNKWIFGSAFDLRFYDPVTQSFESTVAGHTFERSGHRPDGFLRSKAAVSQTAFVEIKLPETKLLHSSNVYRGEAFALSREVAGAVAQVQRVVLDFERTNGITHLTESGSFSGEVLYAVRPKAFLIVGHYGQLKDAPRQIESFEMARRNFVLPEIFTFDELFERARFIASKELIS